MARSAPGAMTGLPPASMSPAVCVSSPARARRSVDLPQPDAPTRVTNSPSATSRHTLSSATMRRGPSPNTLQTERKLMALTRVSAPDVQIWEGEPVHPAKRLIHGEPDHADEDDAGEDLVGLQEAL